MSDRTPTSDLDYFSDEFILNPYPYYKQLRDQAPAVWLSKYDVWMISRHKDVSAALQNPEVFCSGKGVTLNPAINEGMNGNMVMQDGSAHMDMRLVFMKPMMPKGIAEIRETIQHAAEQQVEKLWQQKSFDAVKDLAWFLPLTVVTDLIGLDEEGKTNMLEWGAGVFNAFGHPSTQRAKDGMVKAGELMNYVQQKVTRDMLVKDGWADRLYIAVEDGRISQEQASYLMFDYIIPSLDTTISAISNSVLLFSENPEQWDLLRENPSLIPNAINEIIRIEPPIRAFVRFLTTDFEIDGIKLMEGDKAFVSYASGSHDERKFKDPETFDITRENVSDHLALGKGNHSCAGANLARLEMRSILESLMKRVERFECGEAVRVPHNTLRGIATLPTTLH